MSNQHLSINTIEAVRTQSKERVRKTRRNLVGGAVAAVAVGALFTAVGSHENSVKHDQQLEAFKDATTPVFRTVALRGGTQLRITPEIKTISPDSGDFANLAGEIPKDQIWVATAPLVNPDKPQWIAVTRPGDEKDIHSVDDRAVKTVWVHYGPDLFPENAKGGAVDWGLNSNGTTEVNGVVTSMIESTFAVDAASADIVDSLVVHK